MIGEWQASIAHPAMSDWVTVAVYLMAVLASAFAFRKAVERHQHRERSIWRIIALLMLALAINELLDLQSLVTIAGRASAHANGWYTVEREPKAFHEQFHEPLPDRRRILARLEHGRVPFE